MTSSFEPRELFEIALQHGHSGASEAHLRTAINRAYYATFWLARGKTYIQDREQVHTKVIGALKKIPEFRQAWRQLESLYHLRLLADYHSVPENPLDGDWERNWSKARSFAEYLIPKFQ